MKISNSLLALGACAVLGASALAQEENDYILEVTEIGVKLGHDMKFREGVKAYMACYAENGGQGSWSVWRNVDGKGGVYHIVSDLANWAEMDTPDEAGRECWPTIEEQVSPHMTSVSTSFSRPMPEWSGDAEGYDVVRLHRFRVDDAELFQETVGAITSIMKESDYEHIGAWYDVINNDSNEPDYFVVAHYDNFAAMDEDRAGPYAVVAESGGEARADELWEQFGEALHDDWEYSSQLLRRDDELGHGDDG